MSPPLHYALHDTFGRPTPLWMVVFGSVRRVAGVLLIALAASIGWGEPTAAQDRGVPLFGPPVMPDTVAVGAFDRGRIWSFADPPLEYFQSTYDVNADPRGLAHARRATVRLPDCSGAFVSAAGLVLTAARCVRSRVPSAIRDSSFYAVRSSDERQLPGMYVEQVVAIDDVTGMVDSVSAASAMSDEEALSSGRFVSVVEKQLGADVGTKRHVEVVREGGNRYVAYTYRRYTDVRLVFNPDPHVQASGPIGERQTYPQHAWDVAVLRAYEDGAPVEPEEYLEVATRGARPGDAVFAIGHPRTTTRTETAEQLAFQRDILLPDRQSRLRTWMTHVQAYVDSSGASGASWWSKLEGARARLRQMEAQREGLATPYLMERLQKRDDVLGERTETGAAAGSSVSEVVTQLATVQAEKRKMAEEYRTFSFVLDPTYSSSTLRRALIAYSRGRNEDVSTASVVDEMRAVQRVPRAIDVNLLAAHLKTLREQLEDDSLYQALDPQSVVGQSVFSDSASAVAAIRTEAIPSDDPAVELVASLSQASASFQESWADVTEREHILTDSLDAAIQSAASRPIRRPRDRAPRIADGRIQGYPYNGTLAPPFTTFFGLFARAHSVGGMSVLPARWAAPDPSFDRSTPLTTVATTDLGSGAPGAPLLNTSLQIVGVVFDGNRQSASAEYIFLPDRMRAVAVDVRGMIAGLQAIYGAQSLVEEMTTGSSSP